MHIALATCSNLPDWEVDDRPFHDALRQLGVEYSLVAWDDSNADWSRYDACLIRTTWDYMERRDEFVEWAQHVESVSTLFNPARIVEWNTHKSYLRDLDARGVPVIPTEWFTAGERADLRTTLSRRGWARGFLKPAIGATARETMRFEGTEEEVAQAQAHLDRMLAGEDMMLQPYLDRVESEGEVSAIFIDGDFSHGVRKVPVPGDYRVQDDFGAHDEPFEWAPEQRDFLAGIVNAVDPDLVYARVDLLQDDDGEFRVSELELVEPSMFFRHGPEAPSRLAQALRDRVEARLTGRDQAG